MDSRSEIIPATDIGSRRKRILLKSALKRKIPLIFMIGPVTLWMLILIVVPLSYIVVISFLQKGLYGGIVAEPTLHSYARILDWQYFRVFGQSLFLAVLTTAFCLLAGFPFAWFIVRTSPRLKIIFMMLLIIPFWTNSLVRTYGWILLLQTEGIINHILLALGLIDQPLSMLYTRGATLLGMVYTLFPFMILPIHTAIDKLDPSLLEAASDLYARRAKTFWRITLPLTKGGIFAGCIMVFIPTLGYFFISDLLEGGKTLYIGNLVRNQFLTARDWPFGAALSVLLIVLTLILVKAYTLFGGKMKDLNL